LRSAVSSVKRKAALTVIDLLCDAILKWLAPILSFTTDEAWRMYRPNAEPSVHLTLFPEGLEQFRNDALAAKWETIRNVRRVVTGALELERKDKKIGSSLEASPVIYVADSTDAGRAVRHRSRRGLHHLELRGARGRGAGGPRSASMRCRGVAVMPSVRMARSAHARGRSPRASAKTRAYPDVSPRDAQRSANGRRWGSRPSRRPCCLVRTCAREQGPITTAVSNGLRLMTPSRSNNTRHGVWVPAFAGTTPLVGLR
jgi:isoleucyl-tRNA synthetase